MARRIQETPILTGKDAKRFLERMRTVDQRRVSPEEYKRMREDYERMKAIEKF
ncbi:MAG TPA: hypothetical protein VGC08_05300 [Pedobacter sp.]